MGIQVNLGYNRAFPKFFLFLHRIRDSNNILLLLRFWQFIASKGFDTEGFRSFGKVIRVRIVSPQPMTIHRFNDVYEETLQVG